MEDVVSVMKRMQRANPKFREAWGAHCTAELGGLRDPSRHDASVLQQFLDWWNSDAGAMEEIPDAPPVMLVEKIKRIQRSFPEGKQAWIDFCDTELGGKHDPNLHSGLMLRVFLKRWDEMSGGVQEHAPSPKLVEKIKHLQRCSAPAKQAWIEYTENKLGGKRDPSLHSASALEAFLAAWEEEGAEASEEPPPTELVEKIKAIQRMSPAGKQAWIDFCDTELGGVRDPGRHQANVLSEFLSQWEASAAAMWEGGDEIGKIETAMAETQPLEFVKQGARLSPTFKAAWLQYCENRTGGPARYDEAFLRSFAEYVGNLVSTDLAAVSSREVPAPVVVPPRKRPSVAPSVEQPAAKRTLMVKRNVADKIRQINAEVRFTAGPIRLGAVAAALSKLEEALAIQVLLDLEDTAEGVDDPNVFIRDHAAEFE